MPKLLKAPDGAKSTTDNRSEWEIERDKAGAIREAAMKSLTVDQMEAIHNTYDAMQDFIQEYSDMFDVTSETARKMQNSFWAISHQFHMGDR